MAFRLPAGFRMSGVHCGIKQAPEKLDLMLLVADEDAVAAGVYTQNVVHAASVAQNREKTPHDKMRFVVANSGNANTCTGSRGWEDSLAMVRLAAEAVGVSPQQGLVMSTGMIGEYLPMDCVGDGISAAATALGASFESFEQAAQAILTTDQSSKTGHRQVPAAGHDVSLAGMAKGAGMIGPNMATMLAVLTTDAVLTPRQAQEILTRAVDASFNCISVEGHMSTSDTVLLFASGASGWRPQATELSQFEELATDLCRELAVMIPTDGEGASHLIVLDVKGCRSREEARQIATTIADSALVKTGIAGADPNWGRIVSAAGYAGVRFDPDQLSLSINGFPVFRGEPVSFDQAVVSQSIRDQVETHLELKFGEGDAEIRFWTSDLTAEYVRFNSEYST